MVRLGLPERLGDLLLRLPHPAGEQVAALQHRHLAVERLAEVLDEFGLAGSGRSEEQDVHSRAVFGGGVEAPVEEVPRGLLDPVELYRSLDGKTVERVVLGGDEGSAGLDAQKLAVRLHEGLDKRIHLVLRRSHPLDVGQHRRDAAGAALVLAREPCRLFSGYQRLKPVLGHLVAPDRRPLACAEPVEADGVVEAPPDAFVDFVRHGVGDPDGRHPHVVEQRVDEALFGASLANAGKERMERPEKRVGFVNEHQRAFGRFLDVAHLDPDHA